MIIELKDTTTSAIAKKLVQVREEGGAVALGRVLTLVLITSRADNEAAINAANEASGEHPMRLIVVHTYSTNGDDEPHLDAEIRVGRDAGAGDVVVLHASGPAAEDPETLVQGLLLPDAPVVVWWPSRADVGAPSTSPLGHLAQVRIVDTHLETDGYRALCELAEAYSPGDSNLSWTRLTHWRAQLAAVLDQPPYEPIERAEVTGRRGSSTAILMGAWLRRYLDVPVDLRWRDAAPDAPQLHSVRLVRPSGDIELERIDLDTARLRQPGQPDQLIPMVLRESTEVIAEELRSLAPDEIYATVLQDGVPGLCDDTDACTL